MRKKINLWVEGTGSTDWILRDFFESKEVDYDVNTVVMSEGTSWGALCDATNIFVRVGHPAYRNVPDYLKQIGVEYIYYLDDNFWEIKGNSLLANHYRNAMLHLTLEKFLLGAKIVLTSSKYFKWYLESRFGITNVVFCQAPVNIDYIDSIPKNYGDSRPSDVIRIGYAGTPKTDAFEIVWSALKKIRANYSNVEIEFFGDGYDKFEKEDRVTLLRGLPNLKDYYFNQASRNWDIGLAPLIENNFTKSKTENKFREYAAFGIAGIYSNISTYSNHVENGVTGLLAEPNSDAWYDALELLINNESLRKSMADNAVAYAKQTFHFNAVAKQWRDPIQALTFPAKFQTQFLAKRKVLQAFSKIFDKDLTADELASLTKLEIKPFIAPYFQKLKSTLRSPLLWLLFAILIVQILILFKI